MVFLFGALCFVWSFLEASLWWVAPDVAISIGYLHRPARRNLFFTLALLGAMAGGGVSYYWALHYPEHWKAYVLGMPFHTASHYQGIQAHLRERGLWALVVGAWTGMPYKLFCGAAALQSLPVVPVLAVGVISRAIRFGLVLLATMGARRGSRSVAAHPTRTSFVFLALWAGLIFFFDIVINRRFLHP